MKYDGFDVLKDALVDLPTEDLEAILNLWQRPPTIGARVLRFAQTELERRDEEAERAKAEANDAAVEDAKERYFDTKIDEARGR